MMTEGKTMSVDTYRAQDGTTIVRLYSEFAHLTLIPFRTRHDAAIFLNALRKRIR